MNWNLFKSKPKKVKFDFSSDWLNAYSDKSLWELFDDFHYENGFDNDTFFIKLLIKLKPSFEIPFSEIRPFSSSPLYIKTKDNVKEFLSTVDTKEIDFYYRKMIDVLSESYVNFLFELIKQGKIRDSIDYYKKEVHRLCEDCLHALIYDSAKGIEFLLNDEVFKITDKKSIFFEIIDETIKPEYFRGRDFHLCFGDPQDRISKWYEIAIKHAIFKLSNLNIDDKIALIPVLKENLFSEQNKKLAKGFNYSGIDGLEDFYKTFLERFEKERDEYNKKEKKVKVENKKMFFQIGTRIDINAKNTREKIEKKELQFKNLFIRLKHKFSNNPTASDFESLFNAGVKYYEKFNWNGNKKEFLILIKFLKEKGIVRQTKIQQVLTTRFLINGEKLSNSDSQSSTISQVRLEAKSEWIKTLEGYLI